jgi:hypothetical protein
MDRVRTRDSGFAASSPRDPVDSRFDEIAGTAPALSPAAAADRDRLAQGLSRTLGVPPERDRQSVASGVS